MTPGTSPGAWLLDLDTGGEIVRLGSESRAVTSRDMGGVVRYRAGLPALDAELETDSVSLRIRPVEMWRDAARIGPFRGRAAILRYYRGEDYVEDALVVVAGYIDDVTIAPPDAPDAADISIVRAEGRSNDVCDAQATVTDDTFSAGGYADNTRGAAYPIIIGAPGRGTNDSDTSVPPPTTPAIATGTTGLGVVNQVLVAYGHTPAATIELWDVSDFGDSSSHDEIPVEHTTDDLGRAITVANPADGVNGTLVATPFGEIAAGWKLESGWGRGLLHKGRAVVGLGDVLAWGADTFAGSELYDHGEIEARRERLNRYDLDLFIAQLGVPWDEWVAGNLEELFQIETVAGPRGLYWREIEWRIDPAREAAALVCDRSTSGIAVTRESGIAERAEGELVRELTVVYAPVATDVMQRRITYGAVLGEYVVGSRDTRHRAHPLCARAATFDGSIAKTIHAWPVWDPATADLVAQLHVDRLAMPHRYVSVSGGEELLDLAAYSTVRVVDARIGLDEHAIALPQPRISAARRVTRVLRIPPAA